MFLELRRTRRVAADERYCQTLGSLDPQSLVFSSPTICLQKMACTRVAGNNEMSVWDVKEIPLGEPGPAQGKGGRSYVQRSGPTPQRDRTRPTNQQIAAGYDELSLSELRIGWVEKKIKEVG